MAPYRAILRYYRCDTPYGAILFKRIYSPQMVRYPPLVLNFTQAHLCDTPFCNVSRDNCAIPHKNTHKRVLRYYLRPEKVAERKFPEFFEFSCRILPRILLRIFPEFFEVLRFVGNGDQKKFTKNPRHFSMQNSQANTKNIFTKIFWRAGKVILSLQVSRDMKSIATGPLSKFILIFFTSGFIPSLAIPLKCGRAFVWRR